MVVEDRDGAFIMYIQVICIMYAYIIRIVFIT
jgi:hypothetical protein